MQENICTQTGVKQRAQQENNILLQTEAKWAAILPMWVSPIFIYLFFFIFDAQLHQQLQH